MNKYLAFVVLLMSINVCPIQAQAEGMVCGCTEFYFGGPLHLSNLIDNGSFEFDGVSNGYRIALPGSSTLQKWDIDGAGVVLTGNYWQASDWNNSVELNYFASGGISQEIPIEPGVSYHLEFDLSGEPGMGDAVKELQVFWGGELFKTVSFDTTGYSRTNMGWKRLSFELPALHSNTAVLKFFGSTPSTGNGGVAIDNVVLDQLISTVDDPPIILVVPEASNLILFAISIAGFAFIIIRRQMRMR